MGQRPRASINKAENSSLLRCIESSQLDDELPCIESSQLMGLGRTTMYRILATTAFGWPTAMYRIMAAGRTWANYHVSNHRNWMASYHVSSHRSWQDLF